jgi:hypothetical protein
MLALRLVYLAFCAILRILLHLGGEALEREAELVVLRHEFAVRRRTAKWSRLDDADRALFAGLVRVLRRERRDGLLVAPATLLRWHRDLARRRWHIPSELPDLDTRPHRCTTSGRANRMSRCGVSASAGTPWSHQISTLPRRGKRGRRGSARPMRLDDAMPPARHGLGGERVPAHVVAKSDATLECQFKCQSCHNPMDVCGRQRTEPKSASKWLVSAQPRRFRLTKRRGWDSNPRPGLSPSAGFQDRCVVSEGAQAMAESHVWPN